MGGDLLGTIFHDLIPYEVRKIVAAYYTNVLAAEFLAMLTVENENIKGVDFACGSGGLLVSTYRQKKRFIESKRSFRSEDHIKFIENDLLGVDVMPFAANIAASNLALQTPELFTNKINIAIWDSTELVPNSKIPSLAHIKYSVRGQQFIEAYSKKGQLEKRKGRVQLSSEESEDIELGKYDLVIMNPPFTRQERIPKEYKDKLYERFSDYEKIIDGQMSYYSYFILLADKFLKENGKFAFVLPAAFLRNKSILNLRKYIIDNYNVDYIISGKTKLNFSEATWRREILFVASKATEDLDTKILMLNDLPENSTDLLKLTDKIKKSNKPYKDEQINNMIVPKKELKENLDWFRFIVHLGDMDMNDVWDLLIKNSLLDKFDDIYSIDNIVIRGIETYQDMKVQYYTIPSNVKRAIRKEDVWIFDEKIKGGITVSNRYAKDNKINIPENSYDLALRTISDNDKLEIGDKTDYVVIDDFTDSNKFFFGERTEFKDKLDKWGKYVESRKGNLIILRRYPILAPGTFNVCYYSNLKIAGPGTTWMLNLEDDEAKIITLWFYCSINIVQIFRVRVEDVWIDIHKWILKDMFILNPKKLDAKDKKILLKLFEEIKNISFINLYSQYTDNFEVRKRLDKTLLTILGYREEEIEEILKKLYDYILTQFSYIIDVMESQKMK